MKKKKKLIIILLVIALLVPTWYFNNYSLKLTEQTIYSSKTENDIKIAVISDLHGEKLGKENSRITDKIAEQKPDLIFILGDMYTKNRYSQIDTAVEIADKLSEIAETYVVTGDHDFDDEYDEKLLALKKVHLMNYEKSDITVNGTNVTIYGIDNVYFNPSFDLHNEFDEPDSKRLNILLAHIPEIDKYENFGVDLIFSGDTHGGIIRLPIIGPLYYDGYVLPKLTYPGQIIDKGLYSVGNKQIFVTSGIGNYPVPLRFLNRPEICMITLKKEISK